LSTDGRGKEFQILGAEVRKHASSRKGFGAELRVIEWIDV